MRAPPTTPDDGRPLTVDPNLEDFKTVADEIVLVARLGSKWRCTFHKLPLASYGVEWAAADQSSGRLRSFVHFVHGKAGDDGAEVRLSRILRGQFLASTTGCKFTVVIMRGKESGHVDGSQVRTGEPYAGAHGEQPELFVRIGESDITLFKKD